MATSIPCGRGGVSYVLEMGAGVPLGPYSLVRRLAKGGMAEIFLARKEGPEGFARELVVKRILPHLSEDGEFRDLFREEARIVARLNHPHVVNVYDFGEAGGTHYLVMELVRGVDLRAAIVRANERAATEGRTGAIPAHHAAKILSFVCEGLSHAHALQEEGRKVGLVHRDVTPSNVLLSFDGAVKIGDFGVAKLQRRRGREPTQVGMVRGKYAYLSPEQARGEKLDARSDLFNVGILLFEAVTGETFYPHDQPKIARGLSAAGKMWESYRLDRVPPKLRSIIERATAPNRKDRYENALALRAALEQFVRGAPIPSDSVEIGNYIRGLFPDALEQDRVAPRAAGTVPVTGLVSPSQARLAGGGTAPLTPSAPFSTPLDASSIDAARASTPSAGTPSARTPSRGMDSLTLEATQPWNPPSDEENYTPIIESSTSSREQRGSSRTWLATFLAVVILAGAAATAVIIYRDSQVLEPIATAPRAEVQPAATQPSTEATPPEDPESQTATLQVSTFPTKLPIRLDDQIIGMSPQEVVVSAEERHSVEAVLDSGEGVARILLQLGVGETRSVVLPIPLKSEVQIVTTPPNASIEIDGRDAGLSPLTIELDPGPHDVIASLDGYTSTEQQVETAAGANNFHFALAALAEPVEVTTPQPRRNSMRRTTATGTLTISTTPWSSVWLDGRPLGLTPLANIRVRAGRHTLTFRSPNNPPVSRRITVHANQENRVQLVL